MSFILHSSLLSPSASFAVTLGPAVPSRQPQGVPFCHLDSSGSAAALLSGARATSH